MSNLRTPYVNPKRTICEVLRSIYDIIRLSKDVRPLEYAVIVGLLEEAYMMGKKMDTKLRQYKNGYDDGWYEETKDIELKKGLRIKEVKEHAM